MHRSLAVATDGDLGERERHRERRELLPLLQVGIAFQYLIVPFALSCAMRSAFCCALDGTRGGGGADAAVEDMPRAGVGCVPARGAAATSLFDAADSETPPAPPARRARSAGRALRKEAVL